jgi:excinuclease ABC subunit C
VYVFRDRRAAVLYVGKARSLRSRVRSYFTPSTSDGRFFIPFLPDEIGDLETVVTANEKEAALLENQLIKEHRPRWNVKLRDDKDFLSIRIDTKQPYPRLEVVRRPRPDGARYFGPYDSATAARQTLRLVNRHFQLRTCTDTEMRARVRPCLQHQIDRCPAPCVHDVDRVEYAAQVRAVELFLDGRHDELVRELRARMERAAAATEYERAAVHRDQIRAVERVRQDQHVTSVRDVDQDVVGIFRQADQAEIAVLVVRGGKLVSVRTWDLRDVALPDDELVASFLSASYGDGAFLPDEILLPCPIEAADGLADVLSERRGRRVTVAVPRRGDKARLVEMAAKNAEHAFREKAREREDVDARLGSVMKRLRLPRLPRRIECIDVSHHQGADTVAAIVSLRDGAPDRARYRTFRVKRARGGDDYGAMFEVLSRRLRRGRDAEQGWDLPDLLLVDGGKGQLAVALAALSDLGAPPLAVAALAKEKESAATGEKFVDRVYLPGQKNPIALRQSSPALLMLALARDEAHRASNALREKLGKKRTLRTALSDVDGVGPITAKKLLRALGSVRAVRAADEAALIEAGATRAQARAIHDALGVETSTQQRGQTPSLHEPASQEDAEETALANAFAAVAAPDDG